MKSVLVREIAVAPQAKMFTVASARPDEILSTETNPERNCWAIMRDARMCQKATTTRDIGTGAHTLETGFRIEVSLLTKLFGPDRNEPQAMAAYFSVNSSPELLLQNRASDPQVALLSLC